MIATWRIKDWVCVSFKPAHKGSVTDLDVNQGHDHTKKSVLCIGRQTNVAIYPQKKKMAVEVIRVTCRLPCSFNVEDNHTHKPGAAALCPTL